MTKLFNVSMLFVVIGSAVVAVQSLQTLTNTIDKMNAKNIITLSMNK